MRNNKLLKLVGAASKPLGCMTDALGNATASFEVLQRQLGECATMVEALQTTIEPTDTSTSLQMSSLMVNQVAIWFLVIFFFVLLFFLV